MVEVLIGIAVYMVTYVAIRSTLPRFAWYKRYAKRQLVRVKMKTSSVYGLHVAYIPRVGKSPVVIGITTDRVDVERMKLLAGLMLFYESNV